MNETEKFNKKLENEGFEESLIDFEILPNNKVKLIFEWSVDYGSCDMAPATDYKKWEEIVDGKDLSSAFESYIKMIN